jgi:tetratricopeptide (TPR) repeat protein
MQSSFNQLLNSFVWNGLGLCLLVAPVAIGSVHWPVWLTLAALSATLLVAYVLLMVRRGHSFRYDGLALLAVLAGAVMLLQLLPLGDGLLAALSPTAAQTVNQAREFGFDVPGRISVDPVATVELLCLLGCAVSIYLVTFNLAFRDGAGPRILAVVGISGAIIAAIAVAHAATGTRLLLGFYEPDQGMPDGILYFSTFVNNNHAAAFLNLAALVLVGQWQKAQFGRNKALFAIVVMLTMGGSVLMTSRGGLLALVMAGGMMAFLSRWSGGTPKNTGSLFAGLMGILVTAAAVSVFLFMFDLAIRKTEGTTLFPFFGDEKTKLQLWGPVVETIKAYQWTGAGAGGFLHAFSPLNSINPMISFFHAENEPLEALLEYGVVIGGLLLVVGTWLYWKRFPFARTDGHHAGAFCGLMALVVQSPGDFALRIPGVLVPAVAVFGAMSGAYARQFSKRRDWSLRVSALKALPVAVTLLVLVAMSGMWVGDNARGAAYAALGALEKPGTTVPPEQGAIVEAKVANLYAHDPHFYTILGRIRMRQGLHDEAGRLLEFSAQLCPGCLPPNVALARVRLAQGDQKKAFEYLRMVAESAPAARVAVFRAVAGAGLDPDILVSAWKDSPDLLWEYARYLWNTGGAAESEVVLKRMLRQAGYELKTLDLLGTLYLTRNLLDQADEAATYLMALFPDSEAGFVLQGRILAAQGRSEEALAMFDEALLRTGPGNVELSLRILQVLAATRNWDRFESVATELRSHIGDDAQRRAEFLLTLATREQMRGNYFAALAQLDQAEAVAPFAVSIPLQKAEIHLQLGKPDAAAAEYRKVLRIDPTSAPAAQRLKELEQAKPTNELL